MTRTRIDRMKKAASEKKDLKMSKTQIENFLVSKGIISGTAQYGGFLGMLESIRAPLDLIGKMFGKGLHVGPPPPKRGGNGMHIKPPPFIGSCFRALVPKLTRAVRHF